MSQIYTPPGSGARTRDALEELVPHADAGTTLEEPAPTGLPGAGGDAKSAFKLALSIRNYDVYDTPLEGYEVEAVASDGEVVARGRTGRDGAITLLVPSQEPYRVRVFDTSAAGRG